MTNSSNVLAVAMLAVGLAVGAVGGFLAGASSDPAVESSPVLPPREAVTTPVENGAEQPKPLRGRAAAGAPDLARTSPPAEPAGEGTITGVVLTRDGAPLSGVVVRAVPVREDDESDRRPSGPPPDLDAETKRRVADLQRERSATREAATDAAGAYALTRLTAGAKLHLTAWRAGYRIERTGRDSDGPVRVGARCDFRAMPVGTVHVKVLLPDGTPPEPAAVQWSSKDRQESGSEKCRRGEADLVLDPGAYELTATSGPASVYRSDPVAVNVAADAAAAVQEVTLRLACRPGVRGRVTFASGDAPRQFRVAAVRLDGTGPADPARLLGDATSAWINGREEYALTDLAPGTWLVGVTFRGRSLGPSGTVTVGADLATLDLRVEGEPRDWVKVWVRGPDGEPIRDASITCGSRGPGWSGEDGLDVTADPDGSYRVEHYENGAPMLGSSSTSSSGDWGAETKREYYVQVESPSYGKERATYDPVADREVTVRFGAAARLAVTLEGWEEARDRERFQLTISPGRWDRGHSWESPSATIDAAGVGTFPPAKPAVYEIALNASFEGGPEARRFHRSVTQLEVTLRPGDNTLTLPLPTFHEVVVTVEGPVPSAGLLLERPDGAGRTYFYMRQKPAEGTKDVSFDHLASGRYRIVDDAAGDMWITVPGEARVVFRPRPFDAARVSIDEKGRLADAGLAEGDLVVALDGTEFQNEPQWAALLAAAKAKESVKLTVLRGERRLDVTVDPRGLDDGGRLVPWVR